MSLFFSLLVLAAGFVLLIKGADWLVEGATAIARTFKVSDLAIGLTIVAFGTSAPELLVNIVASIQGNADIVMGDIVGSNIANTFLVLGAAAVITPLAVQSSTVWKEIPLNLLAGLVLFAIASDLMIDGSAPVVSRSEGIILIGFFIIFLYYTFGMGKIKNGGATVRQRPLPLAAGQIMIGCILLPTGGHLVVSSAETIALRLGISEALIGLTIVALGTSLPEAAAACVAAWKKKADIAVGNVVGSNIFNICWVLGLSAMIRPIAYTTDITIDMLIVVVSSLLLFFLVHHGPLYRRIFYFWKHRVESYTIAKSEGVFLLLGYVAYIVFIGLRG